MPDYLRINDVASLVKADPPAVEEWCERGFLRAIKLPPPVNEWRIEPEHLAAFLAQYTVNNIPIRQLVEQLLHGLAPGAAIVPEGDTSLLVLIKRPTVQRLSIFWWEENSEWFIQIRFWPGDILSQAKIVYRDLNIPEFLALRQDRAHELEPWGCRPVPHMSFVQRHLVYEFAIPQEDSATQAELDAYLERYVTFWKAHQTAIRQYGRDEGGGNFAGLLAVLEPIHPLSPTGMERFKEAFLATARQTVNFTPGLFLGFSLPYTRALALDAQGQLVPVVRARVNHALSTWGERLSA